MKTIKIGKCKFGKTKIPVIKPRTRKQVLVASSAIPESVIYQVESAVIKCLEEAAVITGILALFIGGLTMEDAIVVFSEVFSNSLDQKVDETMRCLVPTLTLPTEHSEWVY